MKFRLTLLDRRSSLLVGRTARVPEQRPPRDVERAAAVAAAAYPAETSTTLRPDYLLPAIRPRGDTTVAGQNKRQPQS
jgi:hypothetical protein